MKKFLFIILLIPLMFYCTPEDLSPGEGVISIEKDGKKWKGVEISATFNPNIPNTWFLSISKEGNRNRRTEVFGLSNVPTKEGSHLIVPSKPGDQPGLKIFSQFTTLDFDVVIDHYLIEDNPYNRFEISSFDPETNEAIGSFRVTVFKGEGSNKKTLTFSSDEFKVVVK